MLRRLMRLKKEFALLFVVMIALFLVLEVTFAVADLSELNHPKTGYRTRHEIFHHGFIPNSEGRFATGEWHVTYQINSLGFRDREYDLEKLPNVTRILMLGDSYTEGYGVEAQESFSKQLELMLNEHGQKKYEVINTGVGSYSPILEYLVLRNIGLSLQPDLIILNYDWSDAQNDLTYSKSAVFEDGKLVAVPPPEERSANVAGRILLWLSKHSYVYQFFAQRLAFVTSPIVPYDVDKDPLILTRDNLTDDQYAELLSNSEPYLLKISRLADENDIPFVIHIYPYAHQVSGNAWRPGRRSFFLEDKVYPTTPFELMEKFGQMNNITVISSLDAFTEHENPESLFFRYDGHFTAEGHKLVAGFLRDALKKKGFIS